MISRHVQIWISIVAAVAPGVSTADVNVCIENGAKIFRSDPCKGTSKPIATYKSLSPVVPMPPQRRLARPFGSPSQTYSPMAQQPSANRQARVIYGQSSYRSDNTEQPGLVDSTPLRQGSGMVTGGSLDGSIWPNRQGGMIHGGPLSGSIIPGSEGGMVIGGPLSGTILPSGGGMIHGGPLSGSIVPGSEGGIIHGGPFSGSIIPPR